MIRQCMDCGAQLFDCNGFVKAGDWCEAINGKLAWWKVRERCWRCVPTDGHDILKDETETEVTE